MQASLSSWADLRSKNVEFSWRGWLPKGSVTLLVGGPGRGKSVLALTLCHSFTAGRRWPDGTAWSGPQGRVLWCECDMSHSLNVDRARSWGQRLDRMVSPLPGSDVDVRLHLPEHRDAVARVLAHDDVRFAVVDGLRGACGYKTSRFFDTLTFLDGLARDTGKPILVTYSVRLRRGWSVESVFGEESEYVTLKKLCRVVWGLDMEDPSPQAEVRLRVIRTRIPISPPPPLDFKITEHGLQVPAARLADPLSDRPLDRACRLLRSALSSGPVPAAEMQAACKSAGLSWSTMKRAKQMLRLVAVKTGGDGHWIWRMP